MPVPWVQLIKLAPTILSLTNDLRRRAQRLGGHPQGGIDTRLHELETDLAQQAEGLHLLARQVEGLTVAVAALRRSLLLILGLGGGALLLALAALFLVLFR
jgi:hypothetical protein